MQPGGDSAAATAEAVKPHNRLKDCRSPYLLQHAANPVAWWPWCDEAFAEAAARDVPVFLSIGYSTCHWCHVMAHESFESADVAQLLNAHFVCIKVDREERPDVDATYMEVCQALTGGGGWPLNIVMTPSKLPFYAATYIPRTGGHFGRAGMLELIPHISKLWQSRRSQILTDAKSVVDALMAEAKFSPDESGLSIDTLVNGCRGLERRFDVDHGGFGYAPKFPAPHNLALLMRAYSRCVGPPQSLAMVEKTLTSMRNGGIYDHLGFGFHRYSTDDRWHIPHYEKMLYDQAGIAIMMVEAYQETRHEFYATWALEIFEYVSNCLRCTDERSRGAFFAAEDADSEGVEGKFYVWTYDEIVEVCGQEAAAVFAQHYGVSKSKDAEPSTLRLVESTHGDAIVEGILAECRSDLLHARNKRIRPHRDENILADWNAFYCVALARASRAIGHPDLAGQAEACLQFILAKMRDPSTGRLFHHFKDGVASVEGTLDDYAFTCWALCELYMKTFDATLLDQARELMQIMISCFWDTERGGFFYTSIHAEKLLSRRMEATDNAYPSGNSAALMALGILGGLSHDVSLKERAVAMTKTFCAEINRIPYGYSQFVVAATDFVIGPVWTVSINAKSSAEARDAASSLGTYFQPRVLLSHQINESAAEITFQPCLDEKCKPPVSNANDLIGMMASCRHED